MSQILSESQNNFDADMEYHAHDMTCYDMTSHDLTNDMTRYDMKWHEMT